jgi:RHS repeat-associated protein
VFFAGRRIAQDASSGVYFYYADQTGSTTVMTNASGTPCYQATFTPYGEEHATQTTCQQNNYKFTGFERDAETGLDYTFARYYDSRLGRFLSADPFGGDISNPQSLNRYAYVENDPASFADPSGEKAYRNPIDVGLDLGGAGEFEILLKMVPIGNLEDYWSPNPNFDFEDVAADGALNKYVREGENLYDLGSVGTVYAPEMVVLQAIGPGGGGVPSGVGKGKNLLNAKSRCAKLFQAVFGMTPAQFNAAAQNISWYYSPNGNTFGTIRWDTIASNGDQSFINMTGVYALTPSGGPLPAPVVLGPNWFTATSVEEQGTKLHEAVHSITGMGDPQVFSTFSQYGLSNNEYNVFGNTHEFTEWLIAGCPP